MIFKIVRKSMNKKRMLLVSIFILVVLSSLFIGLNYFTYDTLENNYNETLKTTNHEDFRLYPLKGLDEKYDNNLINKVSNEQEVVLNKKNVVTYDSPKIVYGINQYHPKDDINKLVLNNGRLPKNNGEIVVQPLFLEENNVNLNDYLKINNKEYKIVGTAYFAEYIIPVDMTNGMMVPDLSKYAPIYMNDQSFDELNLEDEKFNNSFYYAGKFNESDMNENIDEKLTNIKNTYKTSIPVLDSKGQPQIDTTKKQIVTKELELFPLTLAYKDNLTISGVNKEIKGGKWMFSALSILLIFLIISLAIVLVNSVFKTQKKEMGILKAEGIEINQLAHGFSKYIIVLILVALLVGGIISIYAGNLMLNLYTPYFQIYHYPNTKQTYEKVIIILGLILVIINLLIYILSIKRNLKQPILKLMNNSSNEHHPKINITKFLKKVSFYKRYQINIILRNKSKTILLFFGIFAASFLILMSVSMYTSMNDLFNNTYKTTFTYKSMVTYSNGHNITKNNQSFIKVQGNLEKINSNNEFNVSLNDNEKINIQGYDYKNNDYVHLYNEDKELLNNKNGLTATDSFMKKYNLNLDDEIIIENPYNINQKITFPIVDVTNDDIAVKVYGDISYLQKSLMLEDNYANGQYYNKILSNSEKQKIKKLDPNVIFTTSQDLKVVMKDQLHVMKIIIIIIVIFSSIVAFITLFTISSIIIESNKKTISIMKVLGYSNNEIKNMTIGIYKWFVLIIYISLIPILNYLINKAIILAMKDMDFTFQVHLNVIMELFGLIIIFSIYLLSAQLSFNTIKKIKLSESLSKDE